MHSLTAFFDWLLTASLRASALTVGVCFVQFLLQKHLSPRWRYALWLPVLVVLLMPVLPESRWSAEQVFVWEKPALDVPPVSVIADATASTMPTTATTPSKPAFTIDWSRVRVLTWAGGTLLVLLIGGASFARTLVRVRRSRQGISDDLATRLDEVSREVGLRHKPRLVMSPQVTSPAVTGLLRPLLLPPGFEQNFTAEEKQLILHHELMHLKRGDLPMNTLLCVLLALHWFNPLLWLAFFKVRADREAACDAQVLENATPQRRSAYGHALLKIESAFAPLRLSLGFIGILQRHASLRARIRSIAAPTRTRPLTGLLVTACMLAMTFLGVKRAATEDKNAPEIYLTARFIEINGARNDAGSADKAPAEVLADLSTSQKDTAPLRIVFDDSQHQLFMRRLSSRKGVDLMSTPSVITRSGQKATIEVARDFGMPPGTTPPEKKVGVMLNLLPTLTTADEIELTLNPRIVEFEGIVKNAKGEDEPVFIERKADARLTLKPGQTVLLDLGSRSDTQDVEDVDIITGKTTRQTDHFTRRAIVLVTAQLASKNPKNETSAENQSPATIDSDKASYDPEQGISRHSGNARLKVVGSEHAVIEASAEEMAHHTKEGLVIIKAPLELTTYGFRITCDDVRGEAVIDLKTGGVKTRGASFKTEQLSKPEPEKPAAEAQAALLRAARPQQYDFAKANLGDVLRFLATDAKMKFISLPEDHAASKKLVTFSIKDSPFAVLETISKANGLMLVLDRDVWHIRPSNDGEVISRSYPLLNNKAKPADVLDVLQKLIKAPATVKFDEKSEVFHINATRLQHTWAEGYFSGFHGNKVGKP